MATKAKKLDKYSELQGILVRELPINAARIKFITLLIASLLKVQSVNFERLSQGFESKVALGSNLRRIQRFFAEFALDGNMIARLLFKMLPFQDKYGLTMDRTNWKFGQTNINILMIGVIYRGVAMPILWSFLGDKRGNSDQSERIELVRRFIRLFGEDKIDFLTADREFIGDQWWAFLIEHRILFFIRMRENMHVQVPGKGMVKAFWLFNRLALDTPLCYAKMVKVKENWVHLTGMKYVGQDGKTEFLIVASFARGDCALEFYRQRWQIETMFRALKSAGFDLEATHLTKYERLNKLLMLTAIAFVWAYKVGIYQHNNKKALKIKKHGRLEKSLFAYGLENLAFAILNTFEENIRKVTEAFLSCT